MPLENERKFVLQLKPQAVLNDLFWSLDSTGVPDIKIFEQYYLNDSCRIRAEANVGADPRWNVPTGPRWQRMFNFKKKVNNETVELEQKLLTPDFQKLVTVAESSLHKYRAAIEAGNYIWEVDFFVPQDTAGIEFRQRILHSYLIMAEVEMEESEKAPDSVPDFITKNLVYTVPANDLRFKSHNLTDPEQTRMLMDRVKRAS